MLGEDVMLHVKKLRLLQKRGDDIPKDKAIEKTRKYLTVVGNAIADLCARAGAGMLSGCRLPAEELHPKLWQARNSTPKQWLCLPEFDHQNVRQHLAQALSSDRAPLFRKDCCQGIPVITSSARYR